MFLNVNFELGGQTLLPTPVFTDWLMVCRAILTKPEDKGDLYIWSTMISPFCHSFGYNMVYPLVN